MRHTLRLLWQSKVVKLLTPAEHINCTNCGLPRSRWQLISCWNGHPHQWVGGIGVGQMEAHYRNKKR